MVLYFYYRLIVPKVIAGRWVMGTRKVYIEKLAERLHAWDEKIDELKTRADGATVDMKIRYRQEMMELKEMRDRAAKHLTDVREAGEGAWKVMKADFDKMIRDVKKSFKKAA